MKPVDNIVVLSFQQSYSVLQGLEVIRDGTSLKGRVMRK